MPSSVAHATSGQAARAAGDTTADRQSFGTALLVCGCVGTDLQERVFKRTTLVIRIGKFAFSTSANSNEVVEIEGLLLIIPAPVAEVEKLSEMGTKDTIE